MRQTGSTRYGYQSTHWTGALRAVTVLLAVAVLVFLVGASLALFPPLFAVVLTLPLVGLMALAWPKKAIASDTALYWLLAIWAIALLVWPRYLAARLSGLPDIVPGRVLYVLVLGSWLFLLATTHSIARRLKEVFQQAPWPMTLLLLFILWRALSILSSKYAFWSLYGFLNETLSFITPFFIAASVFTSSRRVRGLMIVLVVGAMLVSSIGIIESIVKRNLIASYVPPGFTFSSDFVAQAVSAKFRGAAYRAQATFSHPLLFAEFLLMMLPIAYFTVFFGRHGRWIRALSLLGVWLMAIGIWRSGSRAAILALAITAILSALFHVIVTIRNKRTTVWLWIVLALSPLLLIAIATVVISSTDFVMGRSVEEIQSTSARVTMWADGLRLASDEPLLGYGVYRAAQVLGFVGMSGLLTIDSYFLTLLLESGYPALLLFVSFVGSAGILGLRHALRSDAEDAYLGAALCVSLVGVGAMRAILSTTDNLPFMYLICGAIVALWANRRREGPQQLVT